MGRREGEGDFSELYRIPNVACISNAKEPAQQVDDGRQMAWHRTGMRLCYYLANDDWLHSIRLSIRFGH